MEAAAIDRSSRRFSRPMRESKTRRLTTDYTDKTDQKSESISVLSAESAQSGLFKELFRPPSPRLLRMFSRAGGAAGIGVSFI
jgi:hypothetical protein